jgi:hypothetical protein
VSASTNRSPGNTRRQRPPPSTTAAKTSTLVKRTGYGAGRRRNHHHNTTATAATTPRTTGNASGRYTLTPPALPAAHSRATPHSDPGGSSGAIRRDRSPVEQLMPRYRYELRQGDTIVATGHFDHPQPLEIGERIEIGARPGIVRAVAPVLGEHEQRLVVQLLPNGRQQ